MEERISNIESTLDDFTPPFKAVMVKLDQHSLQIDGLRRKLDEQEITLYQHGAVQREHSRDLLQLKMQITNLDGKVEDLAVAMKANFDAIITLLSQKPTE